MKFPEYVDLNRNFSSIDTFDISLVLPDHLGYDCRAVVHLQMCVLFDALCRLVLRAARSR